VEGNLKSAKYSTTKEFLNLKEDEIKNNLILVSKLDELAKQLNSDPLRGLDLYSNIAKLQLESIKKTKIFVEKMNDYWKFIFPFREYYIIVY
jgi:hypothetical protein